MEIISFLCIEGKGQDCLCTGDYIGTDGCKKEWECFPGCQRPAENKRTQKRQEEARKNATDNLHTFLMIFQFCL